MAITRLKPTGVNNSASFAFANLSATGNITASNASLGNLVSANYFSGNGSQLTNVIAATVTTNAQPNITSVGTLASLAVTGLTTATGGVKTANIQDVTGTLTIQTKYNSTAGDVGITGNLIVGASGAGNVTASYLVGNGSQLSSVVATTVSANAQPNITSVGTLTSLTTSGNITATEFHGNTQIVLNSTSGASEGSQIVMGWKGVTNLSGQGNSSWNLDVDGSNNFRLFSVDASGTARVAMTATQGSSDISFGGNAIVAGWTTIQESSDVIATPKTGATGTVTHDLTTGAVFYHASIAANFTPNFTNVSTTDNRTTVVTLILAQGSTPYYANSCQIDGVAQTIKWPNATAPTPTASRTEFQTFALIRVGSAWIVTGSLSSYG